MSEHPIQRVQNPDSAIHDDGARLDSSAFHKNHDVITETLGALLGDDCAGALQVLEIGSGSGQHICHFAATFPAITWWPSDPNEACCKSIAAWRAQSGSANLMEPVPIDAASDNWFVQGGVATDGRFCAVIAINVIHISPWSVTQGLMRGSADCLKPDGMLILYGPFKENGIHNAASNAAFDQSLKTRNEQWGVRDLGDLDTLARQHNLKRTHQIAMPANNQIIAFTRLRE